MAEERLMRIAGAKFTNFSAEVNPDFSGKVSMKSDMSIKTLEKFKPEGVKQESLKVDYSFKIDYSELGKINIEGTIYILADAKTQKEILKDWKDKKLDSTPHMAIMNLIMQKASLKAFELEEEIGLPLHIKLPLLQTKKEE